MKKSRIFGKARTVAPASMNLIPLIDLALNLVLIMLVIAPSMYLVRLPVKLPEAKTADSDTQEWIRVTLAKDGRISVNGELLSSLGDLSREIEKAKKELSQDAFLLEIDKSISYGMTSRLLDEMRKIVPKSRIAVGTTPVYDSSNKKR